MQNIVLSLQQDGTYKEFLIDYNLTDTEIEHYRNNEIVDLHGKVTIVALEGSSLDGSSFSKLTVDVNCLVSDITEGQNCTAGGEHTFSDGAYNEISNPGGCHVWGTIGMATPTINNGIIGIDWDCVEASTGGSYIPGNNTNNPSNGTQSGAGHPSTQQDLSSGYAPTPEQERKKGFQKQLISNGSDECFSELPEEQQDQINNFLEGTLSVNVDGEVLTTNPSSYDQSDMEFAVEAAQALCGDSNLEFDDLESFISGMDKRCQALAVFRSISKIDSPFTNKIKNYFLLTNTNSLNLQDLATGESVADEPEMPANVGARVLYEPAADGTIILQFNNTHLDTATTLGFINTFYHELVHAYILRLYYSGELLNEYPIYTDLKIAIDNFLNDETNTVLGDIFDKEMHDIYVDFIDEIAESIVAYCNYNNINGVNLVYAKKLVWGGLNGYDVFFNNLTQAQQNEAQTLLAYENSNITANAKGAKTCN